MLVLLLLVMVLREELERLDVEHFAIQTKINVRGIAGPYYKYLSIVKILTLKHHFICLIPIFLPP